MKRSFLFTVILILMFSACSQSPPVSPTPSSEPLFQIPVTNVSPEPTATATVPIPTATPVNVVVLQRGVNMSNALEAPNEGEWGLYLYEDYFELVKQAGFDFVRVPITWNGHAAEEMPYTIDPAFFFRVDQVIEWALERDLSIIIELHSYNDMMTDPWNQKDRYNAIWAQLADHYKDYPPQLIFELLNEPNTEITAPLWNQYIRDTLAIIRVNNPTRDVVIGPVNWSNYDWVSTLDLPEDDHLIVTFHYYLPFEFTHQGAEWVENSDPWLGTTWDGTEAEKAEITAHFDSVAEWAQRRNVRILLGEFGAYSKADMDSRVRWTEYIRSEAERHDFAWSYWEFGAGFGIYDPAEKVWREELLKALIP